MQGRWKVISLPNNSADSLVLPSSSTFSLKPFHHLVPSLFHFFHRFFFSQQTFFYSLDSSRSRTRSMSYTTTTRKHLVRAFILMESSSSTTILHSFQRFSLLFFKESLIIRIIRLQVFDQTIHQLLLNPLNQTNPAENPKQNKNKKQIKGRL